MGGQRNRRVRNHEAGLVAGPRMCIREGSAREWPKNKQRKPGRWGEEGRELGRKQRSRQAGTKETGGCYYGWLLGTGTQESNPTWSAIHQRISWDPARPQGHLSGWKQLLLSHSLLGLVTVSLCASLQRPASLWRLYLAIKIHIVENDQPGPVSKSHYVVQVPMTVWLYNLCVF